jgi:hypothetical protein
MKRVLTILCSLSAFALGGCAGAGVDGTPPQLDKSLTKGGKADEWGPSDDPSLFSNNLEYRLEALPMEGEAENIPWTGSYWPVYEDSINKKWNGSSSKSPAAKFGEAFGITDLENKVSQHHGIDHFRSSRKECESSSDCDGDTQAAKGSCAKREGAADDEKGVCIPTWWGICHAWAPAAILEPEPKYPVTKNGVEFKVNDIKALLTLVYNKASSKFVSLRCNVDSSDIDYDLYNRPTSDDIECKDTNPGTYHVLLANYLGLMKQSFNEDRTFDSEVWNQPIRSFKITKLEEISAKEANLKVGVPEEGPPADQVVNFDGELTDGQWQHEGPFAVVPGTRVTITMVGTLNADLYVRFASQPNETDFDCAPKNDGGNEDCSVDVPEGQNQVYVSVHAQSGSPEFTVEVNLNDGNVVGVSESYMFNPRAVKLYWAKSEVKYISESPTTMDGNLANVIDNYTRTDRYEYILELDEDGKIIGGEWLGLSKKSHPDFLWLPTGRYNSPIAGGAISFNDVKALLDESMNPPQPEGTTDPGTTDDGTIRENGEVSEGGWTHFGPYMLGEGDVSIVLSGDGDGDLYVKKGSQPTADSWDCRPYQNGTSESCTESGPGEFYISVYGYKAATFEIVITGSATSTTPGTPSVEPTEPTATVSHVEAAGNVDEDDMVFYEVTVKKNQKIVVRTESDADIDLYIRMNLKPSEAVYDQRAYTYGGNETLTVVPTADGVLHIGVHGYEAGAFSIHTADE